MQNETDNAMGCRNREHYSGTRFEGGRMNESSLIGVDFMGPTLSCLGEADNGEDGDCGGDEDRLGDTLLSRQQTWIPDYSQGWKVYYYLP